MDEPEKPDTNAGLVVAHGERLWVVDCFDGNNQIYTSTIGAYADWEVDNKE